MIIKTYVSIFILLFLTFFLSLLFGQQQVGQLSLWQTFPGGLNTKLSSHLINDTEFQQCDNVYTDEDVGVTVRGGVKAYTTSRLGNEHIRLVKSVSFTAGEVLYVVCGTTIVYHNLVYYYLISTVAANSAMWGESYNNQFYFGGYNSDRWEGYFGVPWVVLSTSIPQMRYSAIYVDKLMGINVNESYGGSKLVYSDVGNPTNFPALNYIYIDKDDNNELTGMFVYKGNLYVTKKDKMFLTVGLDDAYPSNDGYYKIIDGVGCLFGETIQESDGLIYFVSLRGVEEFDGNTVRTVSQKIESDILNSGQIKHYDDFTVATSTLPIVSGIEDHRYWIAIDTGTDFINDVIYVLDKKKDWVRFTGLPTSAIGYFNGQLILGTGNDADGYLQKYDDSYTGDWIDGSSAGTLTTIVATVKTKDFAFNTFINDKSFKELWLTYKSASPFTSPTFDFYIDKSVTTVSQTSLSSGSQVKPYITKINRNEDRFRYVNFKLSGFERIWSLDFFFDVMNRGEQ